MLEQCKHKFRLKEIIKKKDSASGYCTKYTKASIYYCTKCLEEVLKLRDEESRIEPDWF